MEIKLLEKKAASIEQEGSRAANLKAFRKSSFPYFWVWMFYYAWVVAFSTWWTATPATESVFGEQIRSMMHIINLLSSAVCVFLIQKEKAVTTGRIGAALLAVGMLTLLIIKEPTIQLGCAILIAVCLGVVNISILSSYIFILNNTEKLYAMLGSNVLICGIGLLMESPFFQTLSQTQGLIVSFSILVTGLFGILFFRQRDITERAEENAAGAAVFHPKLYLTIFISCVFAILFKGVGKGMFNLAMQVTPYMISSWYHVGGLLGVGLYLLIFAKVKKSMHVVVNLSFCMLSVGLLCTALAEQKPFFQIIFALLLGAGNSMGVITMYYMLGIIGKKFYSLKYIQRTIVFVGICGGVAGVIAGNLIVSMREVTIAASVIVSTVMMLLVTFYPLMLNDHFKSWTQDAEKSEIDNEQMFLFKKYKLSKRETDVCKLLLQGYTMRQISGILSLAYPTVNTYCTSMYRKLSINSRTELMVMFKDYMN